MQIMTLIAALPGAVAQGLIWGIMAIGVYLTFRILDIAALTAPPVHMVPSTVRCAISRMRHVT